MLFHFYGQVLFEDQKEFQDYGNPSSTSMDSGLIMLKVSLVVQES